MLSARSEMRTGPRRAGLIGEPAVPRLAPVMIPPPFVLRRMIFRAVFRYRLQPMRRGRWR